MAGRRPIFVGGLDYKVLRASCDQKEEEKKESGSFFQTLFRRKSLKNVDRFHFIPMEGPNGKGHAEMAICSIEPDGITPTSDDISLETSIPLDTSQPLDTSIPLGTSQPLDTSTPLSPTSPTFNVHASSENLIGSGKCTFIIISNGNFFVCMNNGHSHSITIIIGLYNGGPSLCLDIYTASL